MRNLPQALLLLLAIQILPDAIAWKEGPAVLPAGAQSAVLEGDPKKKGLFTMRLKLPPGYKVPVHWHPREERVTVLEGAVSLSFEDASDPPARRFPAGSFYINPPRRRHQVWTEKEGAILQVTGMGPWGIEFSKD